MLTSLALIVFLTVMYMIILIDYERYYKEKKVISFANYIESFSNEFNKKKLDIERQNFITEFENGYNVKVVIFDKDFNLKFDGNNMTPSTISSEVTIAMAIFSQRELAEKRKTESLIITEISRYIAPYNTGVIYGFTENRVYTTKNVLTDYYYMFILSSLQPIDEAVKGIRDFFVYFYTIGLFAAISVSFIFSNVITKPLKSMNNVAIKMSNFDFSESCNERRRDEIGSLAKSLNLLSSNLQISLKKLNETNKVLQNDIDKERKLEKIRKDFVAAVSHDLKTPVSVIQGYAEGIKDKIFDEEETDYYLDIIIDETNKMNTLIKDMLDLSALEGGNITIKKQVYNISEQVKKVVELLTPMAKERDIKILTNAFFGEYVNADYNRIEQVLYNLVTNAIKYAYEHSVITVNVGKDENYVTVEIQNEGEHISKEDFEKVWTKFYKIDKSRNRNGGGTGLGLAISKNIIQLHNGQIGGYNAVNSVVFYFKLKKEKSL